MRFLRALQLSFSLCLALPIGAASNFEQPPATKPSVIAEYPVPPNGELAALVAGPNATMWVAGYQQVSKVTTAGQATTYPAMANGLSIGIGPDGAIWFGALTSLGQIGRITQDGTTTYVSIPPPAGASFYPEIAGLVTGPDGNLWLTDYANAEIIRYSLTGTITYFPIPGGGYPYGITNGPDGSLWVADRKPQVDKITTTGQITEFPLPGVTDTESIALGSDGNLWVGAANGALGRLTPSGTLTLFLIPELGGTQQGTVEFVSPGPGSTIWFTAWYAYPYEEVGLMNTSGKSSLVQVPTSGSGAYAIALGPGARTVWFTETDAAQVGVAVP